MSPQQQEAYAKKLMEIFAPCMAREEWKERLEMVSLEWLLEMANPEPSDTAPLESGRENERVSMADLVKDIKKRGLKEPLIIGVGIKTGRARLEAGNHRVRALMELGVLHAPATCWVGASHVGFEGNGAHEGRAIRLWETAAATSMAVGAYDERRFAKPSLTLPSCPVLMGWEAWLGKSAGKKEAPKVKRTRAKKEPRELGGPGGLAEDTP